ncbi:MAG: CPBP family intramembrane metalloprotease [Micavibrio sp.]|nr:CPBP family intramembrane metalloprotease [Micavibrio sp.]
MFMFLWGACAYGIFILRICYWKGYKEIWNWAAVSRENLKSVLLRFSLASVGMVVFIYFYDPALMFYLPMQRPEFIPYLMVFYPVFSALPQEIIFCSFFFRRYHGFFGEGRGMIFASAIVFAYAHVLYINPVAPTLGFLGGMIFAMTYSKTKSLALVTIEHGLYGNMLFLTGLGWYFYSGSVQ